MGRAVARFAQLALLVVSLCVGVLCHDARAMRAINRGASVPSSPAVAPILPSAAPGYWIDYDADNLTQSGGTVSSIADNGPAGAPLAASGSAKPAYLSSYLNGHAGVSCDGATSWLSSSASPDPASAQMTVYFVGEATSTANTKFLLETTANASTNNGLALYNSDTQGPAQVSAFHGDTGSGLNSTTVYTGTRASTPQIYVVTFDRTRVCSSCGNGTEQIHYRVGRYLESGVLEYETNQSGNFAAGTINLCDRSGPAASLFYQAKWSRVLVYTAQHTPATQYGVLEYLAARYGLYGTAPTRNIIVTGDSISSSGNISTDYESWSDFLVYGGTLPTYQWNNWAFGGRTLADMAAHVTDEMVASVRAGVPNYAFIWGGSNDFANSGSLTAASLFSSTIAVMVPALQAAGVTQIGIIPVLPRNNFFSGGQTSGGFETVRVAFNALLAANAGSMGYTVVAIDGGSGVLTAPGSETSLTYFNSDQVHPNPTSKQTVEAPNVSALLTTWNCLPFVLFLRPLRRRRGANDTDGPRADDLAA